MNNVISSEIYKICKNKFFYAILTILFGINIFAFISGVKEKFSGIADDELVTGILNYNGCFNEDGIFYIILIFVAFLITSEYSNGSIRQMACRGIARWKLVLGQYIAMSFALTIVIFSFGIINLLIFTLLFRLGEIDTAVFVRMNFGLLCMILGTTAIGTFLSYLIKNVGITILASVLVITGSQVFVAGLAQVTNNDLFGMYSFSNMRRTIISFASNPNDVMELIILFLVITFVLITASCILFSKRDVE